MILGKLVLDGGLIGLFNLRLACYQVNKSLFRWKIKLRRPPPNHPQLNHQLLRVFAAPKCQDLTFCQPRKLSLKGSKLFREVYQAGPNWRYFLSLLIPNNYKSEMH